MKVGGFDGLDLSSAKLLHIVHIYRPQLVQMKRAVRGVIVRVCIRCISASSSGSGDIEEFLDTDATLFAGLHMGASFFTPVFSG